MKSEHVVSAIAAALSAAWFFCIVLPVQSYLSHADLFGFGISDLLQEYGLYMGRRRSRPWWRWASVPRSSTGRG